MYVFFRSLFCRAVLLGSLMFAAAPALTSLTLSTNLMNVVLSFGVLSAIGQNLAILPTLTLPMAWYSGEFVDFFFFISF